MANHQHHSVHHEPRSGMHHPPGNSKTGHESPPETQKETQPPSEAGTLYTCPMHPQIRQAAPGNCPICGISLEPLMPALEEDNPALDDLSRRFWRTRPLTVIVTVLAMFGHQLNWLSMQVQSWVELVLSTPVVPWAGLPLFHPMLAVVPQPQPQHVDTGIAYGLSCREAVQANGHLQAIHASLPALPG